MSRSRPALQDLILVSVTVNDIGIPKYKAIRQSDSHDVTQIIKVATGSAIGWYVRVNERSGPRFPPYQVNFSESSYLGVSSIDVPAGGVSPYYHVRSLDGSVKYTVSIPGISPVFDPEMQVENGPGDIFNPDGSLVVQSAFVVVWDLAVNPNTITYTKNGKAGTWPLSPALDDTIEFQIAGANPATKFVIVFPNFPDPNTWVSPFSAGGTGRYPGDSATNSTGRLKVRDDSDPKNTISVFRGEASRNGNPLPPSNSCQISLPGPPT
jgi:hypothetical protein